ncbi:hypothetical protein Poly41_59810 [Novipirellula artificiosorum]|uniref:Uncharacterized protein n=1 Tax=Novipirellula artificiosorum TaxID=2528016 RepID=A0A5C6D962_9BACT|nr:hypothetical protein Poly41_59810 [Novipirellula artificiosorum]
MIVRALAITWHGIAVAPACRLTPSVPADDKATFRPVAGIASIRRDSPGLATWTVGSPLGSSDPQGRFTMASRPFFGMSKTTSHLQ